MWHKFDLVWKLLISDPVLKKDNTSHKFGSKKSKASKFLVD